MNPFFTVFKLYSIRLFQTACKILQNMQGKQPGRKPNLGAGQSSRTCQMIEGLRVRHQRAGQGSRACQMIGGLRVLILIAVKQASCVLFLLLSFPTFLSFFLFFFGSFFPFSCVLTPF